MKISRFGVCVIAGGLATSAWATGQFTSPGTAQTSPGMVQPSANANSSRQSSGLIDASKFNGAQVNNLQGQSLGNINQLLVDPVTGLVRFAVIRVDPKNDVAVPWPSLNFSKDSSGTATASLDATKEKLDAAPKFSLGDADRIYTRETAKPIYDYWAVMWFEEPAPVGESSPGAATSPGS